jgi:hypothetical protein
MKQKDALDSDCRPVAAALFMSGAVRFHCNFYQLCAVIAEAQNFCPMGQLFFERQNGWLFSKVVYRALAQMQRSGFVLWKDEEGWLIVRRASIVFDKFVVELRKTSGFNDNIARYRVAGELLALKIPNDIPWFML